MASDAPPAYDDGLDGQEAEPRASSSRPPTYENVSDHGPRDLLPGSELYSLVLDGSRIYPSHPPSRVLYEFNRDPTSGRTAPLGMQKFRYQLSNTDGEGKVRSSIWHVYDLRHDKIELIDWEDLHPKLFYGNVALEGQRADKSINATYKEMFVHAGATGWSS